MNSPPNPVFATCGQNYRHRRDEVLAGGGMELPRKCTDEAFAEQVEYVRGLISE